MVVVRKQNKENLPRKKKAKQPPYQHLTTFDFVPPRSELKGNVPVHPCLHLSNGTAMLVSRVLTGCCHLAVSLVLVEGVHANLGVPSSHVLYITRFDQCVRRPLALKQMPAPVKDVRLFMLLTLSLRSPPHALNPLEIQQSSAATAWHKLLSGDVDLPPRLHSSHSAGRAASPTPRLTSSHSALPTLASIVPASHRDSFHAVASANHPSTL